MTILKPHVVPAVPGEFPPSRPAPPAVGLVLAWLGALTVAGATSYLLVHATEQPAGRAMNPATGPGAPIAGSLLDLFARDPIAASGVQVVALCAISWLVADALAPLCPLRWRSFVPPAALAALLATMPVRDAISYRTPALWLLAVVLFELRPGRRRAKGMLLGAAAALQPALALFAFLLARATRWRRGMIATPVSGFAALTLAGWLARPGETAAYWLHGGLFSDRDAMAISNQSLHGIALRFGLHGAVALSSWLALAVLVSVVALRRAGSYWADGQHLLAIGLVGCAVVLIEPVTWTDGLLWLGLVAVGRLGHRRQDRTIWPLVALVPLLLPSHVLDPHIDPVSSFLLRNCAGLLALVICVALPFRCMADPLWQLRSPEPLPAIRSGRWRPLLPPRLRGFGRPNLVFELLLVQVGYGFYTWIRNAAPDRAHEAIASAQQVMRIEQVLHIDVEGALNRFALSLDWLENALEYYYKTMHFAVPLAVLAWLYWRHPAHYRPARTALFICTGLALIGYWAIPLAPPRLTPGHGFRDTLHPGADADPLGAFTKLANQFAAMPSLHVGWSIWCAVVIVCLAPYLWLRVLGALYPACTLFAILATANHWVLDAVGGVVTLVAAWAFQFMLTGQRFGRISSTDVTRLIPPDRRLSARSKALLR